MCKLILGEIPRLFGVLSANAGRPSIEIHFFFPC